jgi:hypothetical protein
MKSQGGSRAVINRTDQWQSLVGEIVEVRLDGGLYRRGLVAAPGSEMEAGVADALERIPDRSGNAV